MNTISRLRFLLSGKTPSPENHLEDGMPTSGHPEPEHAHAHVDHRGRPDISADDSLNLFRHLTGIESHASMTHSHFSAGGRAAPNLGIYSRVVLNESTAKKGYRNYSWLINGCLGLQIVIAATLTALGAAGGSHKAVTVFGAMNTVIAGLLTFLKGSGLPNRLKYYQSEWQRVREFIEQRERDFGRPNCDLDVYTVIDSVEKMYEEVKVDLEASIPDRFAGFRTNGNGFGGSAAASLPRIATGGLSEKLGGLASGHAGSQLKDLAGAELKDLVTKSSQFKDLAAEGAKLKGLVTENSHLKDLTAQGSAGLKDLATKSKQLQDLAAQGSAGLQDLATKSGQLQHLAADGGAGFEVLVTESSQFKDLAADKNRLEELATGIGHQASLAQVAAKDLETHTEAIGQDARRGLSEQTEKAAHIESSFFHKLKDLSTEIGDKARLAKELLHHLQEAKHTTSDTTEASHTTTEASHEAMEVEKEIGEHAEPGGQGSST
jgi:hypothetical protein